MIVAFFESMKYTGHLIPIALLRVYLGYQYIQTGLVKVQGEYLDQPLLAGQVSQWVEKANLPEWYQSLVQTVVIPYWQVFAYLTTTAEFLVGSCFIIGFLVRPMGLLAALLAFNLTMIGDPSQLLLNKIVLGANLTLAFVGAGRCLGIDYFFFKRHRGLWW